MGKLSSPRSPRPDRVNDELSSGTKDYQTRCLETVSTSDLSLGRRISGGELRDYNASKAVLLHGLSCDSVKFSSYKGVCGGKKQYWFRKHLRLIAFTTGLMGLFLLLDSIMFPKFDSTTTQSSSVIDTGSVLKDDIHLSHNERTSTIRMYDRLLNMASSSLTQKELKPGISRLWKEPFSQASAWLPCAHRKSPNDPGIPERSNGYILVSANGGLNQQRVAVCNAVAVASLLNATLVIPRFLYSSVWRDVSQFADIYQEEHFINTLKNDVNIVKEVPAHLKSLNLETIGSMITDADLVKEAKPSDYIKLVLPLLLKNGAVHFLGFGNRLGFDPVPSQLQKLRCKCNFHALKFVPSIQKIGALLVSRIRKHNSPTNMLHKQLLGNFLPLKGNRADMGPSKYLALHLRFEEDMVAYSLCDFGGGEVEKRELQSYREAHFPLLLGRLKSLKPVSPAELRLSGRCPLTPEEAALVLAGLGFKHDTYIYLAGSHIYGGQSRMQPFTNLYPNLVTKEDLLTTDELQPFRNFSSQLAALDFIACATADVFAMTDSGSQLSSLVSGYRTYFGAGHAPTLRPNKKILAEILLQNSTIRWSSFEHRVRRMIEEGQRVHIRGYARSIYRHPRCPECMCALSKNQRAF